MITGSARGRPLEGPPGPSTRPTSDKIKGAVFSMLETYLPLVGGDDPGSAGRPKLSEPESRWLGRRVLDLYAGTGALGIEALSRGAAWADFVDASRACERVIRRNLETTELAGRAGVVVARALSALGRGAELGLAGAYDLVLVDPPYGDVTLGPVLTVLGVGDVVARGGLVVVEHSRRAPPGEPCDGLRLLQRRRHGDTEISLYLRLEQGASEQDSWPG